MSIKVIDSIMGSGKTSLAIQIMNEDIENNYIYITPFLKEVDRIKENCSSRKFYEPTNIGKGKLDSLHYLLKDKKNIASTHALFQMSTEVTRDLVKANNYILILDEVCDVVEQIPLKQNDMDVILEHSHIAKDILVWDNLNYDGRYNDIMTMALNNSLMVVNNTILMWSFPVDIFTSFKECYVMTYIFDCQIQKYYYDIHNIQCEYYTVENHNSTYRLLPFTEKAPYDKTKIKNKVHIYDGYLNNIGESEFSLSATWFSKEKNKPLVTTLKNNLYNYFRNKTDAKSNQIIWTTFKNYKGKLAGKGFTKSFIACNIRATNEYRDRQYLAYCMNVFLNPIIKQFFCNKGVTIYESDYALSELLQWIWRSAIRDNYEIWIYIPSERMRSLLLDWFESDF